MEGVLTYWDEFDPVPEDERVVTDELLEYADSLRLAGTVLEVEDPLSALVLAPDVAEREGAVLVVLRMVGDSERPLAAPDPLEGLTMRPPPRSVVYLGV